MSKKQGKLKGTFIHGVGASEHLDSSGERIKIEGIDISSLTRDGVVNFEHQSKEASAIIGKIIKAKKILKRSDCDDDHQRYFWDKIKMPYLYVAGELFDAVGHQAAKDVAAMLRYDQQADLRKTKRLINFSIEGARLEKRGANILKCIARKITVTITPCNKVCEAEELKEESDTNKSNAFGTGGHGMHQENFSMVQDLMSKAEIEEPSCQIMEKTMGDYKPKRTFTPENVPDKLKTGDRISYKDSPRAKTGADIYGKPPQEPKFGKSKKEVKKAKIDEGKSDRKKVMAREWRNDRYPEKGKIKGIPYTQDPLQEKEKEVKKGVAEKVQERSKRRTEKYKRKQATRRAPERSKQSRQRQGPVSDPHKRVAVADEKRVSVSKAKADKYLPEEERKVARQERKQQHSKGPSFTDKDLSARARAKQKMKKTFAPTNSDKFGNHGHFKSDQYTSNMRKAIAAGGMGAAPGAKVQGDSLKRGMAYSASNNADVLPSKSGSFSMGKSEVRTAMKILSEDAFNNFAKKEQLLEFLSNKLPKLNKKEIEALAKTVAYYHEKKKELHLKKLIDG